MSSVQAAAAKVPASTVMSLRFPLLISAFVGVVGVIVATVLHHPMMGVLGLIGLGLGLINSRMLQKDVVKVIGRDNPTKAAVGIYSARRLLIITAIAVALGIFIRPDGLGVFFGLAIYQLINVSHTALPVVKELRKR